MTFTNRVGSDLHIKLSSEDEPKVLRASDARVSFVYRESGETSNLQVNHPFAHRNQAAWVAHACLKKLF